MVDITIFELHLDGSEFTANAPWSGDEEGESEEAEGDDESSGGPPLGLFVVGALLAFVGLAVAAKKVRGGDDTDLDDIEADIA